MSLRILHKWQPKLTVINTIAARYDYNCRIGHERAAVPLTTCDSKNKDCCYRACDQCSVDGIDNHVRPLPEHTGQLSWHRWESQSVLTQGKQVNRKTLITKRGNIRGLPAELKNEVGFLAEHLFRAEWQHRQFLEMRSIGSAETVSMVMDLAEHYTCLYQQEVQAAHWHHDQGTIHPSVTYYQCPV